MPDSLEQLDLLLIEEVRSRQNPTAMAYISKASAILSLTLARVRRVSENVTIRYDPRDIAEIPCFSQRPMPLPSDLCRVGRRETVPFRDIIRVRNSRRKQLRKVTTIAAAMTMARARDRPRTRK